MAKSKGKMALVCGAAVLSACLWAGTGASIYQHFKNKKDEPPAPTDTRIELEAKDSVNASLDGATGDVRLIVEHNMPFAMSQEATTFLGSAELESVVIEADEDGASITFTGDVRSAIALTNENATLTFKGITFYDEYGGSKSYITDYSWFAGKIMFEDCTFTHGIRLKMDASMTFEDCTFTSPISDRYGVWVEDGNAIFENCTFTGYRGLKIHEDPKTPTDDIQTVRVDGCLFDRLQAKCGIAVGTVNGATTVALTNNRFIGCRSWDTVGSLQGLDGIYESDTLVRDYMLILDNNEVRETVSNIYYFAVIDGALDDAFPLDLDANVYPTTYVQEVGATVADLEKSYAGRYDVIGAWYLDEDCTVKFSGVIEPEQTGDLYLYAALEDDDKNWTQNY